MGGRLALCLLACSVAGPATAATAQVTESAKQAAQIENECGLKKGSITAIGDQIRLEPSPDEPYDHVHCALGKLGFVGSESEPNAVLRSPLRYIAEGSPAEIAALTKAAQTEGWIIKRTGASRGGLAILDFESGGTMTNGEANKFLDRISKNEFGNIRLRAKETEQP